MARKQLGGTLLKSDFVKKSVIMHNLDRIATSIYEKKIQCPDMGNSQWIKEQTNIFLPTSNEIDTESKFNERLVSCISPQDTDCFAKVLLIVHGICFIFFFPLSFLLHVFFTAVFTRIPFNM